MFFPSPSTDYATWDVNLIWILVVIEIIYFSFVALTFFFGWLVNFWMCYSESVSLMFNSDSWIYKFMSSNILAFLLPFHGMFFNSFVSWCQKLNYLNIYLLTNVLRFLRLFSGYFFFSKQGNSINLFEFANFCAMPIVMVRTSSAFQLLLIHIHNIYFVFYLSKYHYSFLWSQF